MNNLTKAEIERYAIMAEELAEAQQIVGKILRFGREATHPNDPSRPNHVRLAEELGHVEAMIDMLTENEDISEYFKKKAYIHKRSKVLKWSYYQVGSCLE